MYLRRTSLRNAAAFRALHRNLSTCDSAIFKFLLQISSLLDVTNEYLSTFTPLNALFFLSIDAERGEPVKHCAVYVDQQCFHISG